MFSSYYGAKGCPCHQCTVSFIGCHDRCPKPKGADYKAYKARQKAINIKDRIYSNESHLYKTVERKYI